MQQLGKLRRIDAREIWKHEALDFTPWLRDNIELLAEALGLDLDLAESEVAVGSFSADIVAKDVSNDRWVVIENQLDPTDHSHLGQLLTYGAGTEDAKIFVWISPDFREEHRAAIDWLNENTLEDSLFFGVNIELLAVNDSRPAPNFRLVASPNRWRKSTQSKRALSEKQVAYTSFFSQLLDAFKERYPGETNVAKPSTAGWLAMGIGRTGLSTEWIFVRDGFRCEFYIDTGDAAVNQLVFDQLMKHKIDIEGRMGHPLEWDPMKGRRSCRIMSSYPDSTITALAPAPQLEDLRAWAIEEMKRLRDAFRPFVPGLQMTAAAEAITDGRTDA